MILATSMKVTTGNSSDIVFVVEFVVVVEADTYGIVVRQLKIVWEFRHLVAQLALTLT
jgi:hypothetical protein